MDPFTEKFNSFTKALQEATTYDDVIFVCRAIDNLNLDQFVKYAADENYSILFKPASYVTKHLINHFKSSKDLSFHMKVMKALLKPALCMNYVQVECLFVEYSDSTSVIGAECLRIYGWLQNHKFTTKFNVTQPTNLRIHESFVETSLKYSKDTRYFALAIENYIAAYDIKLFTKNKGFTFSVVLTNLENSHRNVHKLLLELFKRLVCCYSEQNNDDEMMIKDVLTLPWNNRNKYHLMAIIISNNCDVLLNHPHFDMSFFFEGIQVGLTIHHLLATSQSLVKVIHTKNAFKSKLIKIISKILWNGEEKLVQNLIKYWFTSFDGRFLEKLLNVMREDGKFVNVSTTSPIFYRLLMLRNAFKRLFNDHELDSRVKEYSCLIHGLPLKIEIFHILIDNIYAEVDEQHRLENILTILKFIRYNLCIEDSTFIDQHVMRKLPELFNFFASRKMHNVEILREIFGIIQNDIYLRGMNNGSYESLTFSLKLLSIVLKQYCGADGSRLCKNTNIKGNLSFGNFLKENEIWDLSSNIIFVHLIKLVDRNENSDLSEMAVKLLVEYFIKKSLVENFSVDGVKFKKWIDKKVLDALNQSDVSLAADAKRYYELKFELLLHSNSTSHELLYSIDLLKSRFTKLKNSLDPVQMMEEGLHLFNLMDCINYGIKRSTPSEIKKNLVPVLQVLLKIIVCHFVDFISDPEVPPTFEILDEKLNKLLEKSTSTGSNAGELKPKLLSSIWFTLRSSSEISESLAAALNDAMVPSEREYLQGMKACIDVNIQILSRCCHKGAIDSGSTAMGSISKIISKEFSKICQKNTESYKNLHSLLVILKHEIDSGKRPSNDNGDIRSSRGLVVMSHKIICSHPAFLKFLMETLLVTNEINSFEDTKSTRFISHIKPIQLHLLAGLIKDSDLAEDMLMYYDFLLLAIFRAYKESKDFVVINALLQLIGAIVPKISNQKSHIMIGEDTAMILYEPKSVTVYEFYVKFTYAFRIGLFDLKDERISLSNTYIIILLEIFSRFEERNAPDHYEEIEQMGYIFQSLMTHECEKIRFLAAKCFVNWQKVNGDMLENIVNELKKIFSFDGNTVHSAIHCVRLLIQRYESSVEFVKYFNRDKFLKAVRIEIANNFTLNSGQFAGAYNFYIRSHLLEFLIFLKFPLSHEVVQTLMVEKGLSNHFGYKFWSEKIKELLNE